MAVKMPVLLDSSLNESAILAPTKGSLRIEAQGVSECQLTLGDKSEQIPMHAWVKVFNKNGLVGIFRRTSRNNNITVDRTVTLRHGIDILQDSVWEGEDDFEGTRAQFLTAILNHQTSLIGGVKPWVLGTCADTSTVTKTLNYDNLLDLLQKEAEDGGDYYFTYDQTVFPWRVSLVAKPDGAGSEFRLNRNIEKCKISDNDSELCTRLILNVNKTKKNSDPDTADEAQSVYRVYNNTAAQAVYGIITKTADIDVTEDTLPGGPFPEADAWAADFLAKRAAPQLQIQIDGIVLSGITGDTWDESRIAEECRVALPDYSEAVTQRVVTIQYPDLYGAPERVSVSLANVLPTYSQSLKAVTKETAAISKETRAISRHDDSLNKYYAILDRQGNILKQAGMKLDANGFLVYADDGVNMIGAKFEVQADRIGMVIGTGAGGNYIKAGEIALAINESGDVDAVINADHINISGTQTAHLLVNALEQDDNGNLVIKTSGGAKVRKTEGGIVAEYGIYDEESLTAGIMVQKINGQSTAHLNADNIYIGNQSSVTVINGKAEVTELNAVKARVSTIEADYITAQDINAQTINAALVGSALTVGGQIICNSLTVGNQAIGAANITSLVSAVAGSDGTITFTGYRPGGASYPIITFSPAASTTLTGEWSGATYTASAQDGSGTVTMTVSTTISKEWIDGVLVIHDENDTELLTQAFNHDSGTGTGTGTSYTNITSFDANHLAYGRVLAGNMVIHRFQVDASSEYTAGSTAGAAGVGLSGIHEITAESTFGVGTAYTISFEGILTNGVRITDSATFNATEAYEAGEDSVSLTGGWQGSTFTVTASNGQTSSTTIATGSGQNGWVLSNDRIYHHVYADGAARLSDDYDLSAYKAIQRAAGAASVTLTKGSWSGGSITVTASNGEEETISFPAVTMDQGTFSGHKKWVYAYSNEAGISGYVQRLEVDATSEYTAGQTAGAAGVTLTAAGWQGGSNVVSASNGESVTVSMPAVTMASSNWVSHKKTVYAYSSAAGITGYIAQHEVDATDEYNAGSTAGYASGHTAGYAEGRTDFRPDSITQDTANKQITVLNAAQDSLGTYSVEDTFNAGWLAYWNSSAWARPTSGNGGVCTIPASTPGGGSYAWFTITAATTYQYDSTNHRYNIFGSAYQNGTAITTATGTTNTAAYDAGYAAGWARARGLVSRRNGNEIWGPTAEVDGGIEKWYTVTVTQGQISATRVTSSLYALAASATAYINGTSAATDSTSRNLNV